MDVDVIVAHNTMQQFDVILVGASVRSLAQSAIRDGLRPFCVDLFGDADLLELLRQANGGPAYTKISSFQQVPDVLTTLPADVPVVISGGIENAAAVLQAIRRQRPLAGMDSDRIAALRDPFQVFPALQARGIAVPEFCEARGRLPDGWLRKPRNSAGGSGIIQGPADSDATHLHESFVDQKFVDGIPASATFVADGDGQVHCLGMSLQLSGLAQLHATGYQFCGNVGPILPGRLSGRLQRLVQALVDYCPLRGVFGVDLIVDDQRLVVLEINPRVTASHELHEWGSGGGSHVRLQMSCFSDSDSEFKSLINAHSDRRQRSSPKYWWRRMVVYADQEIHISQTQQDQMQAACGDNRFQSTWLADIPHAGQTITRGTPVFSVYHRESSASEIELPKIVSRLFPDMACQLKSLHQVIKERISVLESE